MANVHIRDLPEETLEILKLAARTDGRSLNAEVLHLLQEDADRIRRTQEFLAAVRPRKLTRTVDLEALIREERDARGGS